MRSNFRIIGRGLYSLGEAERLTGISRRRIRRWTQGSRYRDAKGVHRSPPIIASAVSDAVGRAALDFGDLLEVRFLEAFHEHGVSWWSIRTAALNARELLGRHRPFSSRIFKTDGRTILAELVQQSGDRVLLDLVRNQFEFERIISPLLYAGIEFNESDEPATWSPLGEQLHVVLDPRRSFGAPIVRESGVPTQVLAHAVRAEGSADIVAAYFEIATASVYDAVEFEEQLESALLPR